MRYFQQAYFLFLLNLFVECTSKVCTEQEVSTGVEALAKFATCSDFNSAETMEMTKTIESDDNLVAMLNTMITNCYSSSLSASDKTECVASYMSTLGIYGIFQSDRQVDDPEITRDLKTTLDCLSTTFDDIPICDKFEPFLLFQMVFPPSIDLDIGSEVEAVCDAVKSVSRHCLKDSDALNYLALDESTDEKCVEALEVVDSCEENIRIFWNAEMDGAAYCGLRDYQIERLSAYESSCTAPPEKEEEEATTQEKNEDIGTHHLVQVIGGLGLVVTLIYGLGWWYKTRRSFGEGIDQNQSAALLIEKKSDLLPSYTKQLDPI
mmetsp:Transcript_10267/g.12457  ORF Transcript_10267/g.12457 Transcript_10267/m.12457 type:complete len:321 (-) Transcript_10267:151-1113(-)